MKAKENDLFILEEIQVKYHPVKKVTELPQIMCSKDAYKLILTNFEDIDYIESFKVMVLNTSRRVLGIIPISTGGTGQVEVEPKIVIGKTIVSMEYLIFNKLVKSAGTSIILFHNHPSGNIQPSLGDIQLTKRIEKCAELFRISVLDHMIVTPFDYYSFADEGKMIFE